MQKIEVNSEAPEWTDEGTSKALGQGGSHWGCQHWGWNTEPSDLDQPWGSAFPSLGLRVPQGQNEKMDVEL